MNSTASFVRPALRALLGAIAVCILAACAAAAQPITQCGTLGYRVDLNNVPVSSNCYPITVATNWSGTVVTNSYPGPNIYTEFPPVPVGTLLTGVTICGIAIPATPGQYTVVCTPACAYCVRICVTAANCLVIKIYPGPCPVAPLPCP